MASSSPHLPIAPGRRRIITAGLLLGVSLGALEATVIGTAMPTVVAALGGLAHYSWVFSAYLLTSTASVPIWGRLSDLYGRRRMYLLGVLIFLAGSAACGGAMTMGQLIAARLVQGLGAGAIVPITQAIIGELFTLEERPRMQAVFSGLWGVASIAGPLVGGFITDTISWRWVFLFNIPGGLLAMGVIAWAYPAARATTRVTVDWLGAALLFAGVSCLLIALGGEGFDPWVWLLASAVLLGLLVPVERRAIAPILPVSLLRTPIISRTFGVVFMSGFALFGSIAFIPLWVQTVRGGTATEAGQALTPLFMGWVITSVGSARATLTAGYRVVAMIGGLLMAGGFAGLALLDATSTTVALYVACFVAGSGMGCVMVALLLAVQQGVERSELGLATSLNQFARSVGAAIGVASMGALLSRGLGPALAGLDGSAAATLALGAAERARFASALHAVFILAALVSTACFVGTFFLPPLRLRGPMRPTAGEEMLEAELG